MNEKCADCGIEMNENYAKQFTVCESCWTKHYKYIKTMENEGDFKPVYMDQGTVPTERMNVEGNMKTEQLKYRNQSNLSYADCCMRLTDDSRRFEDMSDDDLDSIYAVATGQWAYHLTRQAYIDTLYKEREKRKPNNMNEGNTGGDLLNVVYDEVKQLKAENAELKFKLKNDAIFQEYSALETENAALVAALKELKQATYDYGDQLQIWIENGLFKNWSEVERDLIKQLIEQGKSAIDNAKLLTPNKEPGN